MEHYFGANNFFQDDHLRGLLGDGGWVTIRVIQDFRKMKELRLSNKEVYDTLEHSHVVERRVDAKHSDFFIRRKEKQVK